MLRCFSLEFLLLDHPEVTDSYLDGLLAVYLVYVLFARELTILILISGFQLYLQEF